MLISILFLFISNLSYSYESSLDVNKNQNKEIIYNLHLPVVGDRASTVGNFNFNFDTMPGGQASDSIILNSLTVGIGERVEVGIIPWAYAMGSELIEHGITAKYNFYKSDEMLWAVGLSQIKMSMSESENSTANGSGFRYKMNLSHVWNYSFLAFNFMPKGKAFNLGITLKHASIEYLSFVRGSSFYKVDGKSNQIPILNELKKSSSQSSFSIDSNFQVDGLHWLGVATGTGSLSSRLNIEDGVDEENGIDSRIRYLAGLSYIYRGELLSFNDINLSLVYFEGSGTNLGFSSTF
jgi:hypothetical protein